MPINRNISYVTAPESHSATNTCTVGQTGAATEYSRIGPSYETMVNSSNLIIRRQQPVAGRNRGSARISERYEFSEPSHLTTGGGGSGGQAMDEVPLQRGEHQEYSHLQH